MTYKPRHLFAALLLIILLCVIPLFTKDYYAYLGTFLLINALFAAGFNLLFGYGGKLSFGQAAFFGVGAYSTGLMMVKLKVPFLLAIAGGAIAAGVLSVVIGFFCIRRTGMYFALLTMAFGQFLFFIVDKWDSLTGGADGLQRIPVPAMLSSAKPYYYFTLVVVLAAFFIIHRIVQSPFGFILRAFRDNPVRSEFNGLRGNEVQLTAFVLSSSFCGLAGAIFAPFNGSVAPALLEWSKSAEPVIMTIIGGQYFFFGPILGAIVFTFLQMTISEFTTYWPFVIGVILAFMVLVIPGGIIGYINEKITGVTIPEI